jgi:hypothetical protein
LTLIGSAGYPRLEPHDPSKMFRYSQDGKHTAVYPQGAEGPNCRFDTSNQSATIRQAGLCQGAILEQQENLMRD